MPNQEPAFSFPFGNGLLRVGTKGLFRPCLKTFLAPFPSTRLTAFGSPGMENVLSNSKFITKCNAQLLQIATGVLLQIATVHARVQRRWQSSITTYSWTASGESWIYSNGVVVDYRWQRKYTDSKFNFQHLLNEAEYELRSYEDRGLYNSLDHKKAESNDCLICYWFPV